MMAERDELKHETRWAKWKRIFRTAFMGNLKKSLIRVWVGFLILTIFPISYYSATAVQAQIHEFSNFESTVVIILILILAK